MVCYREARGGDIKRVRTRLVIGADGARSAVAAQNIAAAERMKCVFAYHEIIESPQGTSDAFDGARCDVFYQGHLSPDFYAWVFPHGKTASIGVGSANKGFSLRGSVARMRGDLGLDSCETIRREGAPIPLKPLRRWDNGTDVIVADDAGTVVRLRALDGAEQWRAEVGAPVYAPPTADVGAVYISTTRGDLARLDVGTGDVAWQVQDEEPLRGSSAAVGATGLAVGYSGGTVRGIDPTTGVERWRMQGDGNVTAQPVWIGDRVAVGTLDRQLLIVDGQTGREEQVSALQACIPLLSVDGQVLAVVAVHSMPFFAFNERTFTLLALLGGHMADLLQTPRQLLRPDDAEARRFSQQLRRARRDAAEHDVEEIEGGRAPDGFRLAVVGRAQPGGELGKVVGHRSSVNDVRHR